MILLNFCHCFGYTHCGVEEVIKARIKNVPKPLLSIGRFRNFFIYVKRMHHHLLFILNEVKNLNAYTLMFTDPSHSSG